MFCNKNFCFVLFFIILEFYFFVNSEIASNNNYLVKIGKANRVVRSNENLGEFNNGEEFKSSIQPSIYSSTTNTYVQILLVLIILLLCICGIALNLWCRYKGGLPLNN
ncbi:hypothetical protein Mgra_00008383 [Meloidogyne graminicola]|uniref:Uncharacterized protein n=1 Tax=Meloidogyne graminicola TaxID=189291 RepID=A0A8S9ZFY1_9BILA|nr:hypothetical protein Mgra_00008383 [Meloidogyne graminicola]